MTSTTFTPQVALPTIDARTLQTLLDQPGELALIDVSEAGQFVQAHVFVASNVPFSRLELDIIERVPRRSAPVVLVDQGDGIAECAGGYLQALGYVDVRVLAGGMPAWQAAGLAVFDGEHVPSKAFGEVVEHHFATPSITPQQLLELQKTRSVRIIDPRTIEEHGAGHIPQAVFCPGGELVQRFHDLVAAPDELVVVACGGRTRAIVGAQALINAGVPNRVVALEDGNLGWRLAGLTLEQGQRLPVPRGAGSGRAFAADLARRFNVSIIAPEVLDVWRRDAQRSTYVLDVRSAEEYVQGHLPGAVHAPGGQLVQSVDAWVGTRGARLVVVDDDAVRAIIAAHWLQMLGWEVHALTVGRNALQATPVDIAPPPGVVSAAEAAQLLVGGALALHVGRSADYLQGHPAAAPWVSRARLHSNHLAAAPATVLLFAHDARQAALVAKDVAALGAQRVAAVGGTPQEWAAAGIAIAQGTLTPEQRIDTLYWNHERKQQNYGHMRAYLDWELGLPGRLHAAGLGFVLPQPAAVTAATPRALTEATA